MRLFSRPAPTVVVAPLLGADGPALRLGRGRDAVGMAVRFADLVGVVVDGDDHHLMTSSGAATMLRAADWKGGQDAVDAVRAAVDPALFVPAPQG